MTWTGVLAGAFAMNIVIAICAGIDQESRRNGIYVFDLIAVWITGAIAVNSLLRRLKVSQ